METLGAPANEVREKIWSSKTAIRTRVSNDIQHLCRSVFFDGIGKTRVCQELAQYRRSESFKDMTTLQSRGC